MQCKGRYCREKKEIKFPVSSGYFTERRCSQMALGSGPDPELCTYCQEESTKPFVSKNQQHHYQGKVDGPYFEQSWLFGAPRFLRLNAIPENTVSSEQYAAAEAAQRIARQGLQIQEVAMPPKKIETSSVTSKVKPKAKEKAKVQTKTQTQQTANPPKTNAIAVESSEEPLEAQEVTIIEIRPLEFQENEYFLDSKGTVYEKCKDSSVGQILGHWDSKFKQIILKKPTVSDCESE